MRRSHPFRGAVVALAAVLTGGLALTTGTASATPDGPPVVEVIGGQSGPTAGGTALRIYGSGFLETTSVKFGGINATNFKVIDGNLITAVTPAAAGGAGASNTSVDITVTDPQGTGTGTNTGGNNTGWYYTNATLSVSPTTVTAGSPFTITLNNYAPNIYTTIPEVNPLLLYYEGPDYCPPDCGPPPWAAPYTPFPPATDGTGHLATTYNVQNPFNGDTTYDSNSVCPVNQKTVNFLGTSAPASFSQPVYAGRCLMAQTQFAVGTLDTPVTFSSGEKTPVAPVLNLNVSSANQGDKVTIASGSKNWNANPFFGSSKTAPGPGETTTTVQICGIGGNANTCSSTVGNGTVSMTRYKDVNTFSGAVLSGNITVGTDVPHGCSCFVRVRQNRPVAGQFIEATAPLSIL